MKIYPQQVVCKHCDSLYTRKPVRSGEAAHCQRCRAVLYRGSWLSLEQWFALTVTAALFFIIANAFPVLEIQFHGQVQAATLWQTAMALAYSYASPLAIPLAMLIIVCPCLQILLLGWVLWHACRKKAAPGLASAMRLLAGLAPWSMAEVALLSILIAAIKLSGLVQITPGPGTWALLGLCLLLPVINHQDFHPLWSLKTLKGQRE
ncbi:MULTISPECIES: paraquat-inducible protein A [Rahnella]|jgi:paraquat-inducible protein A|uniref:Paraquat-inducible protein A n=1 Tax=Rahnella sp. (strain Y9602) TaxID=2703885 RepID=A0A0H3FN99_RAHSY|nr:MULTISPECIES: paraquat-inducible protein A [Rahnella]AFE61085.1 Paraquat-inducible protein A [Rahnella aquatilis HX2]QBJ07242.1 paraquat-inducible protein A [Rahnella aquatilis]ADW76408.1 Paraquat-inducible protein A [Rahnella aceris]MBU9863440.1 paraquat-inducible protein A [Rahnella aceris]MBU9864537.1 paraquat-inducible protein A [Rahnella aceris]